MAKVKVVEHKEESQCLYYLHNITGEVFIKQRNGPFVSLADGCHYLNLSDAKPFIKGTKLEITV